MVEVDETGETPIVEHDVRQTVVAVNQRVRMQSFGPLGDDAPGVVLRKAAELRVETAGMHSVLGIGEIVCEHIGNGECRDLLVRGVRQLVEFPQQSGRCVA